MVRFLLAVLLLILVGCFGRENRSVYGEEAFKIDTVLVSLPSSVSSTLILPHVFEYSNKECVLFYDHFDHGLVIIDLSEERFIKKINLAKEGPDFVESVGSMAVTEEGSIIIAGLNSITEVNFEGKVLSRLGINSYRNDLKGIDFDKYELQYNQYSGLQYDELNKTILMGVNPLAQTLLQNYTESTVAEISLSDGVVRLLPVFIPDSYRALSGNYGDLFKVGPIRKRGRIIFNFPLSSEVFIHHENTTKSIHLESQWSDDMADPIIDFSQGSDMARYTHKIKEVNYFPLVFDDFREQYYRIHRAAREGVEDSGQYYLTLADRNMNKIMELPFPQGYYIFSIVSERGLMFNAINKHESKLELIRYTFEL